jgi:hypothetical protein
LWFFFYFLTNGSISGTFSVSIFLDLLLLESLQANSIEPSIGKKPNVIQAMDFIIISI